MDNLELMQRIPQEKKDMRKFDPSKSNTIQVKRKSTVVECYCLDLELASEIYFFFSIFDGQTYRYSFENGANVINSKDVQEAALPSFEFPWWRDSSMDTEYLLIDESSDRHRVKTHIHRIPHLKND